MFSADLGVNQVASTPAATDPPFQKVALLLHGDGTNGAQNNTFVDGSTNNFTITRTGNVAQGTFSPFSLAEEQWSNYFDGSGDYLSGSGSSAFDFGTGSFTAEAWIYLTSDATADANGNRGAVIFAITSVGNSSADFFTELNFNIRGNTTTTGTGLGIYKNQNTTESVVVTTTISKNTWHHVAMSKSGTDVRFFLNGTQVGSTQTSTTAWGSSTRGFKVGRMWNTQYVSDFPGYISNLRIVKGTAVYTSNFTPSTSPLTAVSGTSLLTCQSNRFKDNSSNNLTITANGSPKVTAWSPFAPSAAYSASTNGGSGYFDGSGDYLGLTANSSYSVGSGNWTVETWIYRNTSSNTGIFSQWSGGGQMAANVNSSNRVELLMYVGGNVFVTATSTLVNPNQWNHVAIVRNGATVTIYVNGVADSTTYNIGTNSITWTGTVEKPFNLGEYYDGNYRLNGYLTDFRYVVGTAVYTANFTPPTAPLTAITNTQLLLNCINAGIIDNAGKNDIETVGNAQISTSVKKYGTGSMYFDGTGDWLYLADRPELQLGTSNFTIEGWLYLGATGAARGIVGKGTSTTGWLLSTNTSNKVVFTYGSSTITSTGTLSGSTWYHIAVCREGTGSNQTKIYIGGVNDGTGTVSTDFNQTSVMYVGADRTGGSAMNGYIDDLRITLGQALYTSNFTVPTQAFPNV